MSEWTRYWQRIDNTPGSLERLTPEQFSEVRQMVKAAFHAGHSSYKQRIAELEEERDDLCAALSGATDRAVVAEARIEELVKLSAYLLAVRDVNSGDFEKDAFLLVESGNREWTDEKIRRTLLGGYDEQGGQQGWVDAAKDSRIAELEAQVDTLKAALMDEVRDGVKAKLAVLGGDDD